MELNIRFFNRPFKPVALGFFILMSTLVLFNISDAGILGASALGDGVAILAAISATALFAGWAFRSQTMARVGLLLAFTTYIIRASFLFFTFGAIGSEGLWLGLGAALIAGGSYLLEELDDKDGAV